MKIIYVFFYYILFISVPWIVAHTCETPSKDSGKCIFLNNCKPLYNLITKTSRTAQEVDLLKSSQCGYENDMPKVCCPLEDDCTTPDQKPGKCVGLFNCRHITYMLLDTSGMSNMDFIRQSVCNGAEQHNVCCGPRPEIKPELMTSNEICERTLTAFPPKRESKCCGVESMAGNKIIGGSDTKIDEYPWLLNKNFAW